MTYKLYIKENQPLYTANWQEKKRWGLHWYAEPSRIPKKYRIENTKRMKKLLRIIKRSNMKITSINSVFGDYEERRANYPPRIVKKQWMKVIEVQ
jgi:hypothetical protein